MSNVIPLRAPLQIGDVVTVGDNIGEVTLVEIVEDKAQVSYFDPMGELQRKWTLLKRLRLVRR